MGHRKHNLLQVWCSGYANSWLAQSLDRIFITFLHTYLKNYKYSELEIFATGSRLTELLLPKVLKRDFRVEAWKMQLLKE